MGDVALDGFELVELEIGVFDGEEVAGLGLFVDEDAAAGALDAKITAAIAASPDGKINIVAHSMGGEYAAAYYGYLWSAMLDADAFDAFREAGDIFDPETAKRLRTYVYGAGNLRDPRDAYTAFRGRMPSIAPLLITQANISRAERIGEVR